jgi:hypothetical protein
MRALTGLFFVAVVACGSNSPSSEPVPDGGYDPKPTLPSFMPEARVFVSGHDRESVSDCRTQICRHNENVDMVRYGGAIFLVHRTAISQTLGPNSSLHVYRSSDEGKTFSDLATIPAPPDRDLRDPHFYEVGGELWIKALTRLPVNSARDTGVDTIAVATHSKDGKTWSALEPVGPSTWSYWRIVSRAGTYFNAAYEDGDKSVVLFSSTDGKTWTKGPLVYGVAEDTPLETELGFTSTGKMFALVRMDGNDQEYLGTDGRLRTKVCLSDPPYTSFTCPSELAGVRLDGPLAFFVKDRLFVVARKHLHDGTGRKRTALFELTGDLATGALSWKEHGEIPSAGDTAYAGYVMLSDTKALVAWYSGDLETDKPWIIGMFDKTDIWMGTLDFSKL